MRPRLRTGPAEAELRLHQHRLLRRGLLRRGMFERHLHRQPDVVRLPMRRPAGVARADRRTVAVAAAVVAFTGALLGGVRGARAQSPADEAEALIRQGTELRHNGEDARALPYFEGAYHLSRNPRTAAQLGLVKMALGYCVDAEGLLDEALAVPEHPWIARNRAILEQTRANARKSVGEVTVAGSPAGAQVLVNGRPAGTMPLAAPLRLDRGPAELQVRAPGYVPASRALTIAAGSRETVSITLSPVAAPGAPPISSPATAPPVPAVAAGPPAAMLASPAGPPDRAAGNEPPAVEASRPLKPLAFIAGGLATASVVFAIVETVTAAHRSDDFNNHTGPAPTAGDPTRRAPDCQTAQLSDDCRAVRDAWQRARTLAIVGYVGAGVLAGTSAALFALAHHDARADSSSPGTAPRLACAPTLPSPGLSCALRF